MGNNVIAIAVLAGLTFAVLPAQSLAQPVEVGIQYYKYNPPEIKVKVVTTVKWGSTLRTTASACPWSSAIS